MVSGMQGSRVLNSSGEAAADKQWRSKTWLVVTVDYCSVEEAVAAAHAMADNFANINGLTPENFKLTGVHGSKLGRLFYSLSMNYYM